MELYSTPLYAFMAWYLTQHRESILTDDLSVIGMKRLLLQRNFKFCKSEEMPFG
jgi:hypothetical protein